MNIINAQVEVLKEALNEKEKHKVIYGTLDDKVVIGNNTRLYVISKEECAIDLTNVVHEQVVQESTLKRIVNNNELGMLTLTNDIKILDNKRTLRVFTNGEENIYLDERLIKNFDLNQSTFKGKNARNIVCIYEDYKLVGMVLPVVVSDKIKTR